MSLERVAVGDHLMLGGDNMDLALARHLERRLVKRAGELDGKQWGALVHACRAAKEALLNPLGEERYAITIAGRGSKVIGGSLRIDLFQDEVVDLILEGFFPGCEIDEPPQRGRVGLQELGLPYASDPAIPRNLAAFLRRHGARPDAVLFNETCFGLGYGLQPSLAPGAGPNSFGHPGAGGALAFADPDAGLGFAYVMNAMQFHPQGDPRSQGLVKAVYDCINSYF